MQNSRMSILVCIIVGIIVGRIRIIGIIVGTIVARAVSVIVL